MSAFRAGYEVFVHGLPWTVSRKELSHYCSQFGKVLSSSVPFVSFSGTLCNDITDCVCQQNKETGMSKGFGFVTFMNKDAVVNLTNKNVHFLEGSFVSCLLSIYFGFHTMSTSYYSCTSILDLEENETS